MYASIPKNTYPIKHRSDIEYFSGGYTVNSISTEESLTNGNLNEKFSIKLDLHNKYIEIQLSDWFDQIEEYAIALEVVRTIFAKVPEKIIKKVIDVSEVEIPKGFWDQEDDKTPKGFWDQEDDETPKGFWDL